MKRLLITGARGFIGRHCIKPALRDSFEVHALASSPIIEQGLRMRDVTWHVGNLLELDTAANLLRDIRPTHLLHTAWITTHGECWISAANLDWLAAGTRLVRAFAKSGGRKFVSLGTCAEYEWNHDVLVEHETPERPATFYGTMKLMHNRMLQSAARHLQFSAATARVFFAYGPNENPKRVVPFACRQLLSGLDVPLTSGNFWRDYMYVTDIGEALVAVLQSEIQGTCNICSGVPTKLADLMDRLGELSGRPQAIKKGAIEDRPGDPLRIVGSNSLLRSTGWRQRVSNEEGLRLTLDWWTRSKFGSLSD